MDQAKISYLKAQLSEIGKHSMLIIDTSHARLGKGRVWESAVKINQIARGLHKDLGDIPFESQALELDERDPTQWG
tara:strand:- start:523 stop:750 length:228 start_codon:yes stop_codon:yes gene_type:complete